MGSRQALSLSLPHVRVDWQYLLLDGLQRSYALPLSGLPALLREDSVIERFTVGQVPVPQGGYLVRDARLRSRHTRFGWRSPWMPGASAYYATREEAELLAAWLRDKAAGYPLQSFIQ